MSRPLFAPCFLLHGQLYVFGMRIYLFDVADEHLRQVQPSHVFGFFALNYCVKGESLYRAFSFFCLVSRSKTRVGFHNTGAKGQDASTLRLLSVRPSVCLSYSLHVCLFCHLTLGYAKNSASLLLLPWGGGMHVCQLALPSLTFSRIVNKFSLHNRAATGYDVVAVKR